MDRRERYRIDILNQLISNRFEVICSLAKKNCFPETIAGRYLDAQLIEELSQTGRSTGLDICGENGKYHMWVVSAPFFQKRLEFTDMQIKETEGFSYISFSKIVLAT